MKTKRLRIILILILFGGLTAGGLRWWQTRPGRLPDGGIVLHGNVDIRQVELAFNASERIVALLAREGQQVQKGELLGRLETGTLALAVARAAAQAEAQRETVARLEAGSRPEEIRKARADVEAAQARLLNAEKTYRRIRTLTTDNAVSQERADDAKASLDTARALQKAAEEALNLAVAGPRREDIAAARATLKALEADLALTRRQVAETRLYAPASGVIQNRILEAGDMASPQRPVYTLALTDPVWVRVYVSEPDLGKIHPGLPVAVSTDTHPDKRYAGWVGFISPTAEFTPKSVETREVRTSLVYQVRVFVCNPNGELRLGMPATVHVPAELPQAAREPTADPCGGKDR